ncbi:MAG: pilus assembly protein PilP [Deltaproteobacteria bacterium]|nr:pilus assembly protein PilP [Deltaproteobacteria bacterium]
MRITALASAIALMALVGCSEPEINQPTDAEFQQERAALNARVEARKAKKAGQKSAKAAAPARIAAVPKGEAADDSFEGSGRGATYDHMSGRDPFRSFEWERKEVANLEMVGGPLEQYDVSQLSLVAIVWKTGSARALVEDPAGQSYIIGKGTRVGKNEGMVTQIDDNLVVVNETYEDYLGNVTKKDIEMRIRRSEGG